RRAVRARQWYEHRLAVVPQLLDGLLHVGKRPMTARLGRRLVVDPWIPTAYQLLDAGDIDTAIVNVALEGRHVPGQERPIGADGVARERGLTGFCNEGAHIVEDALLGLG